MMLCVRSGALALVLAAGVAMGAAPPARWGELSEGERREIARLVNAVDEAARKGDFAQAEKLARQVLGVRVKRQGVRHWETVNAALDVERLQRLARLGARQC